MKANDWKDACDFSGRPYSSYPAYQPAEGSQKPVYHECYICAFPYNIKTIAPYCPHCNTQLGVFGGTPDRCHNCGCSIDWSDEIRKRIKDMEEDRIETVQIVQPNM